ncbi:Phosphate ABC transporter phosphate-binding protein [Candidatus Promineifilum breve]|uniref:Phosphate ABC transporter phosphate-binding protein n=2 Tax=Candidatus Promineifilum breve TaxID=1806508 RepID=A0A161K2M2_9CHLR|nr:Phosphate ABC transporter phosphate-binding protein [Candidatus Promineifilum breve]
MSRLMKLFTMIALVMLAALLVACGGAAEPAAQNGAEEAAAQTGAETEAEERTIAVSGAFALFPMMTVWAEQYTALHPNITFDVQGGGAGKGMTDVLAGAVDIAMVSRELKPEEIDQGAFGVPVTIDAVVATVNADNPYLDQILAHGLTPEAAAAIWMSRTTTTWGQLLGTDATEAITVYTRSDAAGAAEVWAKYMGGSVQEDLMGTAVNGDPGLAEAVRQDALGIGFNNIGFAYNLETGGQLDGLRVVPLDLNGDGTISADEDFYATKDAMTAAIAARLYPFPPARELYLVTKGEPDAAIVDLYRWILTDGQALVGDAGFVTLSPDRLTEAQALIGE